MVRSLHVAHHGRETNCVLLLGPLPPLPQPGATGPTSPSATPASASVLGRQGDLPGAPAADPGCLLVLTGSEDGTVRKLLCSCHSSPPQPTQGVPPCPKGPGGGGGCSETGAHRDGLFFSGTEVGEHAEGASVRCMDWCPLPPRARRLQEGGDNSGGTGSGVLPASSPGYLVVSAGAKEVLMAWEVSWSASDDQRRQQQPGAVRHRWLGSQMPPPRHGQPRQQRQQGCGAASTTPLPGNNVAPLLPNNASAAPPPSSGNNVTPQLPNNASAASDHRFMAIAILAARDGEEEEGSYQLGREAQEELDEEGPHLLGGAHCQGDDEGVLVIAAASDASVQLSRLIPMSGGGEGVRGTALPSSWLPCGTLSHGRHPVLSLARLCVPGPLDARLSPASSPSWLVFGGATDGSITAWLVASPCKTSPPGDLPPLAPPASSTAAAAPTQPGPSTGTCPATLALLLLPHVHQSGVNGLAVEWVDQRRGLLVLVSAGDDQAIVVTRLRLQLGGGAAGRALHTGAASSGFEDPAVASLVLAGKASATVGAHSSAIKALAMSAAAIQRSQAGSEDSGGRGGPPVHFRAAVITTGLDQRVRFWSLDSAEGSAATLDDAVALAVAGIEEEQEGKEGGLAITLSLLGSAVTEVMEPSAVALLRGSPSLPSAHAAVAGRGVQMFEMAYD